MARWSQELKRGSGVLVEAHQAERTVAGGWQDHSEQEHITCVGTYFRRGHVGG